MSEADTIVTIDAIDAPFPKLVAVSPLDGFSILVTWQDGKQSAVDLASSIVGSKIYAPLRSDRSPFESVHLVNNSVIAWGEEAIDMHVSNLERLYRETTEAVASHRYGS